ncbi:MAG: hypothetical protein LBQ31_04560 [Bacteroidales bacterium]|nr:hypothetical protein [Bacteroidales bacterium]
MPAVGFGVVSARGRGDGGGMGGEWAVCLLMRLRQGAGRRRTGGEQGRGGAGAARERCSTRNS